MNNKYIYKGTWENGVIKGKGVYYHPDGTMVEGFEMPQNDNTQIQEQNINLN